MKIRYFIESALQQGSNGQWYFTPIGVWAHGQGLGMDIAMAYLPGYEIAQAVAEGTVIDLIERGERTLPAGFLEQHQSATPLYRGDRSIIYEVDARSTEDAVRELTARVKRENGFGVSLANNEENYE